eukprot:TRINITY_DN6016_c0_g1_i3.p1 TRINITY_DN6016_c0_g1~~TRINITY_DN6016_c0_g1_i3.p1  ORF type:complete len:405 (+),score=156.69 TRINITY_DN6016_c0_g1_i3:380-1594(+)
MNLNLKVEKTLTYQISEKIPAGVSFYGKFTSLRQIAYNAHLSILAIAEENQLYIFNLKSQDETEISPVFTYKVTSQVTCFAFGEIPTVPKIDPNPKTKNQNPAVPRLCLLVGTFVGSVFSIDLSEFSLNSLYINQGSANTLTSIHVLQPTGNPVEISGKLQVGPEGALGMVLMCGVNAFQVISLPGGKVIAQIGSKEPILNSFVVRHVKGDWMIVAIQSYGKILTLDLPHITLIKQQPLPFPLVFARSDIDHSHLMTCTDDVVAIGSSSSDILRIPLTTSWMKDHKQCHLFVEGKQMPAQPTGFFRGLLGKSDVKQSSIDIAELFESRNVPVVEEAPEKTKVVRQEVESTKDVMNRTKQALEERGEKLSELADKTDELSNNASDFLAAVQELRKKQENKKWYEF